jgi:Zn-dependent protease
MQGWWMYNWYQADPVLLFSWVVWVVVSICLHELGHGYMAMRCGDETPRLTGHMTLNPFVHIPPRGWVLFLLVGITFGLMPVNPSRFRRSTDDALVAAAGPAVNVIQVIVLVLIGGLWGALASKLASSQAIHNIHVFLFVGVAFNIASVIFNLLPIPPLDGSRILAVFSRGYRDLISTQQAQMVGMIILMVMFWTVGGILYPASFDAAGFLLAKSKAVLQAVVP